MNNLWILIILAVLIIVCTFIIFMKMSDIEDDISIVNCTMYQDRGNIPSRENTEPSINDEAKKIALQIEIKDLTLEFYKSDDPYITFYRSTGMIEVETNKRSFAFSLNSILFMKHDSDECGIYYE